MTPDAAAPAALHPARDRLALALDVDDLVEANRLLRELKPWFGVAKVGLELFSAAGPDAVLAAGDEEYDVFLDLKLHDIPTTVGKAARVLGALGVSYLTMHASGGVPMLIAGVEGLAEGASSAGFDPPMALAVTVLTSETNAPPSLLEERVAAALEACCDGVVCAASDLAQVKRLAPDLITVVPGIRLPGGDAHDQGRTATPADALASGADLLVVGRAVTGAPDHKAAAEALASTLDFPAKANPGH
jgi:orotidine-5'-phosphate decarboxylase